MQGDTSGYYRGIVEDAEDPQARGRYRVRVYGIHSDALPIDHLPWAEIICFAGRGFGDVPHFENGDLVAVIFEGGDHDLPAILGGWIANPRGVKDLPPEQTSDYETNRRRWQRLDRRGNLVEVSEVEGELHVRLKSGNAEVKLSQGDDSILLQATGPVRVEAQKASVKADEMVAEGGNVTVYANKRSGTDGAGSLRLYSTAAVTVYAGALPGLDPAALIEIGQYLDAGARARQTAVVKVNPGQLRLGTKDATPTLLSTTTVDIEAAAEVNIRSNAQVNLEAATAVGIRTPSFDVSAL